MDTNSIRSLKTSRRHPLGMSKVPPFESAATPEFPRQQQGPGETKKWKKNTKNTKMWNGKTQVVYIA